MAEFKTDYYSPMDRQYHERIEVQPELEAPIVSIGELGQTIPEVDPTGRFKNMVQIAQAAIRSGSGKIQLTMQSAPHSMPGMARGGSIPYGKDVNEAMRQLFKANEAMLVGVELPTQVNNVSGYDAQHGAFNEDKRRNTLEDIKAAIKFVSDTAGGGAVDVVSFEYNRTVQDAPWNKEGKWAGEFKGFGEASELIQVVDERTGRIEQFRKTESRFLPIDPKTGQETPIDPKTGEQSLMEWKWKDFENRAKEKGIAPEKLYAQQQVDSRIRSSTSWLIHNRNLLRQNQKELKMLSEEKNKIVRGQKEEEMIRELNLLMDRAQQHQRELHFLEQQFQRATEEQKPYLIEKIQTTSQYLDKTRQELKSAEQETQGLRSGKILQEIERREKMLFEDMNDKQKAIVSQQQEINEYNKMKESYKSVSEVGKQKAMASYAEAGIWAMQETHNTPNATKPTYVGPENGWPFAYGSHPQEFVELIKGARKEMINRLTKPYLDEKGRPTDKAENRAEDNPYYQPRMSEGQAQDEAKMHIKGLFDTGHMGMWLQHFHPELQWDDRVKKFNEWFKDQAEWIAKQDVVGGMQVVDSASGAHGHLPPGEGILPIKEAVKAFKKEGYTGFMVSEGHEEEAYNEGRILVQTWKYFHAPFERSYGVGAPEPRRWSDIQSNYAGQQSPPRQMFGSYSPPFAEYKPWSEIPFE